MPTQRQPAEDQQIAIARTLLNADILQRYNVGDVLGKGSYGVVFAAQDKSTKADVALKVMSRQKIGPKGEASVRQEIAIMSKLQHPKILRLHQAVHDDKSITLVLDQVKGGELFKHLLKLQHYSERTACQVIKNLLTAVKYMHDEGIAHRDLKPDNMLLVDLPNKAEEVTNIRVADFGFAAPYRNDILTQPCGTPYYLAPEIIEVGVHKTRDHYTEMVDLWSIGVISYLLLAGYPPFNGQDKARLFKSICRGRVDFSHKPWNEISYDAKDFILRLLQLSPTTRLNCDAALKHKWMETVSVSPDTHLGATKDGLAEFAAREKLKGAVFGVNAAMRLQYLAKCVDRRCKPNSVVEDILTTSGEKLTKVSLKNNYLGPNGVQALIEAVACRSEITEVDLTNSLIDDDMCTKILETILGSETCGVHTLILDQNPITHPVGRRLLAVIQSRRTLQIVSAIDTHCSGSIQRKIEAQSNRNRDAQHWDKNMKAESPVPSTAEGRKRAPLVSDKNRDAQANGAGAVAPDQHAYPALHKPQLVRAKSGGSRGSSRIGSRQSQRDEKSSRGASASSNRSNRSNRSNGSTPLI